MNDFSQDDDTDKQADNRVQYIQPYQWKKGQSGNLKGRPKGKSMKEYSREMLEEMTEEERQEFLNGIPKYVIWEMAEGKAKTDGNIKVELPTSLIEIISGIANKTTNKSVSGEDKN